MRPPVIGNGTAVAHQASRSKLVKAIALVQLQSQVMLSAFNYILGSVQAVAGVVVAPHTKVSKAVLDTVLGSIPLVPTTMTAANWHSHATGRHVHQGQALHDPSRGKGMGWPIGPARRQAVLVVGCKILELADQPSSVRLFG